MPDDQYAESTEHITSPAQIATILKRLQEGHALLTASFPGDNKVYNTAILGVDATENQVLLDELNPVEGHNRVQAGSRLQLQGRAAGIETRFTVVVAAVDIEQNIYLYRVSLPEYVIYRQRRDSVRVPVKLSLDASVTLTSADKRAKARLVDLSAGGFGAIVIDGDRLAVGERYQCRIDLPGQTAIAAEAEIRFASDEAGQQRRLGARLLALPLQEKRRVERLVMQLQRELRRT